MVTLIPCLQVEATEYQESKGTLKSRIPTGHQQPYTPIQLSLRATSSALSGHIHRIVSEAQACL